MHKLKQKLILSIIVWLICVPVISADSAYLPPLKSTGSIFAIQCQWVYFGVYYSFDNPDGQYLDIEALMTLDYSPGVWLGYDSPTPFGVEFVDNRSNELFLYTPCGVKYSRIKENTDGSWTIFTFIDTKATDQNDQPCIYQGAPNLNRCGLHHMMFGYISAAEWDRISSATPE